jgi:hypothetical protein
MNQSEQVSTDVNPSRISYTLKMETIRSSETPVNTISTRRHIPEDGFLLTDLPTYYPKRALFLPSFTDFVFVT